MMERVFVIIEVDEKLDILVVCHKETRVIYAVSNGMYNSGSMQLLVNPDGSPMLYEGEL